MTVTRDPDCLFCKIIAREIPCHKLYEDDVSFAFLDINPANEGHALAIPKNHAANIYGIQAADIAAAANAARLVAGAIQAELRIDGLNLVQANGPGAKQSVMHFHIHILPRKMDDGLLLNWPLHPADPEELADLAARLRRRLASG